MKLSNEPGRSVRGVRPPLLEMLLLVEQERLIAAGLAFEADAVEKARLGGLGHLLGALLLLYPGSVEAAAATLVQDLAVNLADG